MDVQYTKIVQSGDLIEIYEYEKKPTPKRNSSKAKDRRKKTFFNGRKKTRTHRSAQRAYQNFRRLCRSQLATTDSPHMLTLTMVGINTLPESYRLFTKFTVRTRKRFPKFQWIAVPEFQRRGAVHFHVLAWGLPYDAHITELRTREIQGYWGGVF